MRVLLLSAYDAYRHRQWHRCLREGIADWDWSLLTLPARHFAWRVRGNPLQWAFTERETLGRPYDLLLATSMVDLATLRGLVPALTGLPTILYFHENQFAYPPGRGRHGLLEAQMVSIYSALAADLLLFNSEYNRSTFIGGCESLLGRMPDAVPPGVISTLREKSQSLAVPIEMSAVDPLQLPGGHLQLVWNHRWEHDKGPAQLLEMATMLLTRDIPFTLHVVGQQFREQPAEFEQLRSSLDRAGALGCWGYLADREEYRALLAACDVVLSTAEHDFQGLSVLEACALGCTPLVPDRLVYPEWFAPEFRYADTAQAVDKLAQLAASRVGESALPQVDVSAFSSESLLPRYRQLMRSQAERNSVS